jgi:Ca2+-binding RTX toxin-like protein
MPPVALLAQSERPRRRQRLAAPERAGVGATMSATFLGLLMIQGLGHAEEGIAGGAGGTVHGGAASDGGRVAGDTAAGPGATVGGSASVAHASAAGSVLSVGSVIDPTMLTKLSGEARFGDGLSVPVRTAEDSAAAPEAAPIAHAVNGTTSIEMRMAAAAEPVAEIESPVVVPPDEDLGNVGRNETGGDGDDTLIGTDDDDNLNGGGGDDLILGGNGNDRLGGNAGDDELHGEAGDDELDGGAGNDQLYGGAGNDLAHGGEGNDGVYGGAGNDELHGDGGDDRVDGGTGIDRMYGGTGRDILVIDQIHDLALEDAFGADGGGVDTLEVRDGYAASLARELPHASPEGRATFVLNDAGEGGLPTAAEGYIQQVHPYVENVRLTGSVDHDLLGDGRANSLIGNAGDNRIYGGAGDDWLDGGAGDDWLQGGAGEDVMYGSEGDDAFVLGLNDSAVDTIFDHSGVNTVSLHGASASRLQVSLDGQDLRIGYDGRDVAVIDQYVGHEANFAGLDLGQGVRSFPDLLAEFLPQRAGADGADILRAADGGEWLLGKGGEDSLVGSAARDRLEGGDGSDVMSGGAGDDTYLMQKGESGIDRIADTQGRNTVELTGHEGSAVGGFMLGNDLWITADSQPVAIVVGHGASPDSFQGVKVGDKLVDPHELMS